MNSYREILYFYHKPRKQYSKIHSSKHALFESIYKCEVIYVKLLISVSRQSHLSCSFCFCTNMLGRGGDLQMRLCHSTMELEMCELYVHIYGGNTKTSTCSCSCSATSSGSGTLKHWSYMSKSLSCACSNPSHLFLPFIIFAHLFFTLPTYLYMLSPLISPYSQSNPLFYYFSRNNVSCKGCKQIYWELIKMLLMCDLIK